MNATDKRLTMVASSYEQYGMTELRPQHFKRESDNNGVAMITIIATIDRDSHRLRHDREQARVRAVSWGEHEVLLLEQLAA